MVLAVDIGNSTISIGLFSNGAPSVRKMDTHPLRSPSWYGEMFKEILKEEAVQGEPMGMVAASVVPGHTAAVLKGWRELFTSEPVVVGPEACGGMAFDVPGPGEVGPDRIAAAVAAAELCGPPVAVVDFGTATTVNFVDRGPVFKGGAIMPGLSMMARALHGEAARLPLVDIGEGDAGSVSALGNDTEGSMLSGIIYGTAGAVMNIIAKVEKAEGLSYRVALTGGSMGRMLPHIERADLVEPDLTLKGLAIIYERER
jgi:type III pantothenate kinase